VVPFPGDNHLEVVEKKNQGDFIPASKLNAAVPPIIDHILNRMLARQPRDRYQTVSEVIVDLERSRLAAAVPTFADPNRALQDPWIQQCLATSAEPTRLDPETPSIPATTAPVLASPSPSNGFWVLRYRNPAGKLCRARASTEQIALRLRRGRLSLQTEARHAQDKEYHPLSFYAEFKGIKLAVAKPRVRPTKKVHVPEDAPNEASFSEQQGRQTVTAMIWAGGILLVLILLVTLYLFFLGS
jgi:hypothetical protein